MRPLRDLVRERLRNLGNLRQQDLAERLGVDARVVSAVLTGERSPPVETAAQWAAALDLVGDEADELLDAMHLAAASDHVRLYVDRLVAERDEAVRILARYRDRVGYVRYIIDHVEPVPGGGAPPPTPDSPQDLVRVSAELVAERNRIEHTQPPSQPSPAAPS